MDNEYVDRVLHGMLYTFQYLADPPRQSWVPFFASIFGLVGFAIALPIILLISFDVASYAIVRTLGIPQAHPASSKRRQILQEVVSAPPSPTKHFKYSSATSTPFEVPSRPASYFTNPDEEGHLSLSGVGLFSPPHSRTPSPVLRRVDLPRTKKESSQSTLLPTPETSSEDIANQHLRRRKPEIVITSYSPS